MVLVGAKTSSARRSSSLDCAGCKARLQIDARHCPSCGQVYSSTDLQNIAEHQWAQELRPLKLAVGASALITFALVWFVY